MAVFRSGLIWAMLQRSVRLLALLLSPTVFTFPEDSIDKIDHVEAEETQIVITTTKQGSLENLKISIELVDIQRSAQLAPLQLNGLLLMVTRGRYTVPFLRPDAWYGLKFRSEKVLEGKNIVHEEERLVRTAARGSQGVSSAGGAHGEGLDSSPYSQGLSSHLLPNDKHIEIKLHRKLDGEDETGESLYVTAAWKKDFERSNITVGVVKLRVLCEDSDTREDIRLKGDEDTVTVEITIDHEYDIKEVDAKTHLVEAHIVPHKCHRLCWQSKVVFLSLFGNFSQNVEEHCEQIAGTTRTAHLREISNYTIQDQRLIVETEKLGNAEDGVVKLEATFLGVNQSEVFHQTFNTRLFDGRYVLPLEGDGLFAVKYEYTMTKPFHYNAKANFVVDSLAGDPPFNGSDLLNKSLTHKDEFPFVHLSFHPASQGQSDDDFRNSSTNSTSYIRISRSPEYINHEIKIRLKSPCGGNSTVNVLLDDHQPEYEVDVGDVLCSVAPTSSKSHFCDRNATTTSICRDELCLTPSVRVGSESYRASRQCVSVVEKFPPLEQSSPCSLYSILVISFMILDLSLFLY
ncbi:unnamed protein product [Caenorhabditis auriculariae]|uniref:Uncharacterized protein n=1 Tax=Caenorhabditis auriculariae TaxID=2777116 RepID=A0A8S1H755_9PELO|nr:unnamed protein product [Caenorhabditis auriculariae]